MDRFHVLSFYEMKLESFNENGQEHQSLSNRESPSWTLSFSGKAKWLVSKGWKLFDVLRAETIRIKPKTGISISYKTQASQKAIKSIRDLSTCAKLKYMPKIFVSKEVSAPYSGKLFPQIYDAQYRFKKSFILRSRTCRSVYSA